MSRFTSVMAPARSIVETNPLSTSGSTASVTADRHLTLAVDPMVALES